MLYWCRPVYGSNRKSIACVPVATELAHQRPRGILPLAKTFMPLLHSVPGIVAEDFGHACELAEDVFIQPAAQLGLDCYEAEEVALDHILIEGDE